MSSSGAADFLAPGSPLGTLRELMTAYSRTARPPHVVAVAGNAPLEPSDERADAFDAADLVVRVNSFVLDRPGGPRRQGRRADVVVWNRIARATPDLYDRYRERLYLLVEPMRMHGRAEMWPASWPSDLGFVAVPNGAVPAAISEELGLPWREEQLAPTTGLTAAWLAVTLFPEAEVLLTGYSFVDAPDQTEWTYQWGEGSPVGPEHRIAAESAMMRGWIEAGRARLLR